ncbi:MAG: carboxypeptidase-like regulatory domain-containing protein, partial [Bacteroidales bacterium]|nr:carboxypeptidase-like regulatory domain-containing protein [Bacteroidales bacterium]
MRFKTNIQLVVLLLIQLIPLTGFSQDKIRISGFVRDTLTRELLIGANINQKESRAGTSADNNGYFSMVTETPVSLTFSYVGYISKTVIVDSPRDTLIQVSLEPGKALNEVVISATRTPKPNVASLSIR